jgi:endoglucanase
MKLNYAILLTFVFALGGAAVRVASAADETATSALTNGNFESATHDAAWPDDWPHSQGVSWETENGNHFLRLRADKPNQTLTLFRVVKVKPDDKAFALGYRVRYRDVKRGRENWHDARIVLDFKDAGGQKLKSKIKTPSFTGSSDGWLERRIEFLVPDGAATLEIMPALFQVQSGALDLDDLSVTPIPAEPLLAEQAAAETKEAARIAALPKPVPQVPVPPADRLPEALAVAGNQLKTASGRVVWLQGLAVPSLEWSAKGDYVLKSIDVGLTQWKANCIRLPIRDDFWSGHGPYQRDGGMGYRQIVEDAVNACAGHGCYVVIDLHRFRAPTEEHVAFWKGVAARYKNHPAVIYELFNEPHDISWQVWRDGGFVSDKPKSKDVAAENREKLTGFTSVGMQKLVDVVRGTGAKNVIVAGGLDWGYDLSGVVNGYALDDRGGNGIVYSSHVYPWKSDWQAKFLCAADKYPLFLGEVGADTQKMDFIPADRQEDPNTWSPDILGVIQEHHLNWTAWCFHPKSTPRVILDWDYTPTPFWGQYVKKALAGERFVEKRLR